MKTQTVLLALLLLLLLLPIGCTSARPDRPADLDSLYRAAVRDAAVADPWEVSRELTALVPQEPGLIWQDRPGLSPLLVVTWWLSPQAPEGVAEGAGVTFEEEVWVTPAPDLGQRCRRFAKQALDLRLRQLLGLPPEGDFGPILELWVDREALFRPCPDPEVTDHECELSFPSSGSRAEVTQAHRRWMEALEETSYRDDDADQPSYPWTRLGYTYHWGQRRGEVGLSEFILPAGTAVTVKRLASIEDYCR